MAQFTSSSIGRSSSRWLVAVGIFELLLAAAFAAGGFLIPDVEFGFLLTAGILGLTGVILLVVGQRVAASAAEADRISRTGIPGQAAIVGMTQTGMYVNENPQIALDLMVQLPDRPPYPATVREVVPMMLLGRLSSGQPLPVKADVLDPSRVVVDWPAAGAASMPFGMPPMQAMASPPAQSATAAAETLSEVQSALDETGMRSAPTFATAEQGGYTVEQVRAWLREHGVPATATVDRLRDSGRTIGNERLFTMQVTLSVPGQAPRQLAESAAMVPIGAASSLRVGQSLPVLVAPDNPEMLTFDWDRATPTI